MKNIVENCSVYGLESSVKASKYPYSANTDNCNSDITNKVVSLAQCQNGLGHDQFLTGIIVQFDLTLSEKAWPEFQRYHFADFVSSMSTIHSLKKLDVNDQCNQYVDSRCIDILQDKIDEYKLHPDDKKAYLRMIYNIPSGFTLTARITTNYRQLKTIYAQRKEHPLPEWRELCKWIETLPHSEFITGKYISNEVG